MEGLFFPEASMEVAKGQCYLFIDYTLLKALMMCSMWFNPQTLHNVLFCHFSTLVNLIYYSNLRNKLHPLR